MDAWTNDELSPINCRAIKCRAMKCRRTVVSIVRCSNGSKITQNYIYTNSYSALCSVGFYQYSASSMDQFTMYVQQDSYK